jgi:hypothetical protein
MNISTYYDRHHFSYIILKNITKPRLFYAGEEGRFRSQIISNDRYILAKPAPTDPKIGA